MHGYLFFVVMPAILILVQGLSDDEMKAYYMRLIMQCRKEHHVEMSELFSMLKHETPKETRVKCLLACAFKRDGVMNDKGMFDLQHAYNLAELMGNGDEERLANAKKLSDICINEVNAAEVADGDAGCDRSALMFKCGDTNLPKLGFHLK